MEFYIHKKSISFRAAFWAVMAATTLFRLFVIGRIGLGDDEGHYFAFSQNPQLSYFDHPPLIGVIIKFFTMIFGVNEFAVRLPAVLFFFLTCLLLYELTKEMFSEKHALVAVILMNITPVFSFLGAVLTVPDAPLAFFWMLFIYLFWKVLTPATVQVVKHDGKFHYNKVWVKKDHDWLWYVMGVVLGLGLLSKYNMILLVPSLMMLTLFSKRFRTWYSRQEPYWSMLIALAVFTPVIIWNLQNGFASFGFQLAHGFGKSTPHFSFALLGKCLGAQAGYISPFLFLFYWFAMFYYGYKAYKDRDRRAFFLFCFSFPTLFLFNAIASFNEILPHWPATGYMVLTIAGADLIVRFRHLKWFGYPLYLSCGFAVFLTLLVPLQAVYKVLPPELFLPKAEAFKVEDGITKAEKVDVTNELYGWDKAGEKVSEILNVSPGTFVFTHRHYLSSQLSFYVPEHPRIYCLSDRVDAYDFWQRSLKQLDGKDALFVTDNRFYTDPTTIYPFKSWQALEPVEIFRQGRKIRIFYFWHGKEFDLKTLKKEYTADILPPASTAREAVVKLDRKAFWFINKSMRSRILDPVMWFFSCIGNGWQLALLIGAIFYFTNKKTFWRDFFIALAIVAIGGILIQLIKDFVARVRPLTLWPDTVHVLGDKLFRCSFPSGHSQASFAAAIILADRFKKHAWVFFLCAFLVAVSRVYVGAHFPLDTVAGAVLGVIITSYLLRLSKKLLAAAPSDEQK